MIWKLSLNDKDVKSSHRRSSYKTPSETGDVVAENVLQKRCS